MRYGAAMPRVEYVGLADGGVEDQVYIIGGAIAEQLISATEPRERMGNEK